MNYFVKKAVEDLSHIITINDKEAFYLIGFILTKTRVFNIEIRAAQKNSQDVTEKEPKGKLKTKQKTKTTNKTKREKS